MNDTEKPLDIYSFINSKDVAAHCRSTGHRFSALESCVLICMSYRSMTDKHGAYKAVMSAYPDEPIVKKASYASFPSLHECIRQVLAREERTREWFMKSDERAIFNARVGCPEQRYRTGAPSLPYGIPYREAEYHQESGYCSTFSEAFCRLRDMDGAFEQNAYVVMEKRMLNSDVSASFTVSRDGGLIDLCWASDEICEEDVGDTADRFDSFRDYYIEVPVPFEKGDLVEELLPDGTAVPYVFVNTDSCKGSDTSDVTAYIYYCDEQKLGDEVMHFYPNLQYLTGKLPEALRPLYFVSAGLKGELDAAEVFGCLDTIWADGRHTDYWLSSHVKYVIDDVNTKYGLTE